MTTQEIYCDESGFTGNNLLDKDNPYFAYTTVAISYEEAKDFVTKIIKDNKIQNELKFSSLIKNSKGKQIITQILSTFHDNTKISIHHKKYSLACKFFEYVFEPTISSNNKLFYELNFHKYVSNILYFEFEHLNKYAEEIFEEFYKFILNQSDDDLFSRFSSIELDGISPYLKAIRDFCLFNRDIVKKELESLKGSGVEKWILDASNSALHLLLAQWGLKYKQLKVFCDRSKPLQEQSIFFNPMINNETQAFWELNNQATPISYNLADNIEFVDSRQYHGIQLADIFSGVSTFILKENQKGKYANYPKEWSNYLSKSVIDTISVFPELDFLEPEQLPFKRNFLILEELVRRSAKKIPLLENMSEFIILVDYYLRFNLFEQNNI
ncbi:DUF3800 domain-containing protein [Nostoc sp. FACHB-888]|uniref:DUF3800 domain-containing protein n=1 Tax=Nostoc sp. FACHB-888 TaxID=2692842 RepID=UPI001682ABEC|nr:DUF3800 domain-containing protein [Nostoc sp. FACHB-888]MBD2245379.1 DUF3800 domain-containing protein [Nostoc sp. FACHB-888]